MGGDPVLLLKTIIDQSSDDHDDFDEEVDDDHNYFDDHDNDDNHNDAIQSSWSQPSTNLDQDNRHEYDDDNDYHNDDKRWLKWPKTWGASCL